MAGTIQRSRIRFASDVILARTIQALDKLTGSMLRMWQAEDCQVESSALVNGVLAADISNFAKVTFEVKDPTNLLGAPLISKDLLAAGFGATVNQTTWDNGTDQQFVWILTNSDTDIALAGKQAQTLMAFVWATTTDGTPRRIPLAATQLLLVDSGYGDIGSITITPPGARMKNNFLQVINPDNSLYYNVKLRTINGVPTLTTDGPGEA